MLKIDISYLERLYQASASDLTELYNALQSAIELEHSTIPPYLTALYSIKDGQNQDAYNTIQTIVIEEMLHMTIAANILNAIGGHPVINKPGFIPTYPGPLPMNIGDLTVRLLPLSKDSLFNILMKIEEPENPLDIPVKFTSTAAFATIGQFYNAIIDKLQELGTKITYGNCNLQVLSQYPFTKEELFPIKSLEDAVKGLKLIVKQGEGTSTSPLDPEGDYAHYYGLSEIYYGKKLLPDNTAPDGYSYSGDPISLDPNGIWDLVEDSKAEKYATGTDARRCVDHFNQLYSQLLNGLHESFNGKPGNIGNTVTTMYKMRETAQKMVKITDPTLGKQVAPSYEYIPVNS